jgi:BCD family chlorophyll transporter-like MFS transporter
MASWGALVGVPAFFLVMCAAPLNSAMLFSCGIFAIGFGGGLFSHGTLTATMNLAPANQSGLALGAWGAVQATAAGVAVALGGLLHDIVAALGTRNILGSSLSGPNAGYAFVYALEIGLLFATMVAMGPLIADDA